MKRVTGVQARGIRVYYREDTLEAEIAHGLMSIHLIDDLDDVLVLRQVDAALRMKKPMIVWFSAKAQTGNDPALRRIRESGCEYSEENFSEFTQRVKQQLDRKRGMTEEPAQPNRRKKILVLFNSFKDAESAGRVLRRIEAEQFERGKGRPGRGSGP